MCYINRQNIMYNNAFKGILLSIFSGGLVAQKLPAMMETWIRPLGYEEPTEKGMATHSSILAWRIP